MLESVLHSLIPIIVSILNLVGVFIIVLAGVKGTYLFIKSGFDFGNKIIPIELAKAMSLSLSFLLASEILLTVVVQSIEELIVLLGVAGLRVGLHFVLYWDLKQSEKDEELSI